MKNLIRAGVQYGDYFGTISADQNEIDFIEFVKSGVNTKKYIVYSWSINLPEYHSHSASKRYDRITFCFHCMKISESINKIEDILNYAKENDNSIPTYRFYKNISLFEFFNMFKRFNINFFHSDQSNSDYFYENICDETFLDDN